MKRGLLAVAVLAGVCMARAGSAAPAPGGWYVAADLGATLRQDGPTWAADRELGGLPAEPRFHTKPDFGGFVRAGYSISPHVRVEGEFGWRTNRMLSIVDQYQFGRPPGSIVAVCGAAPVAATGCAAPAGGLDAFTAMGNVYLDLWPRRRFHPFVGVGAGVARVHLQTDGRLFGTTGPLSPPGTITIDDTDARLAYQALGGLAMRIDDHLSADLTYRFLASFSHRWNTTTTGDIQLGPIKGKYANHALALGLRYTFRPQPSLTR
ncbi:MAG TPA: outer membrane beta-barrel protein [Polyangia bacterium]|nr:outer membrane beta-barrel protein [Polyangia bacterium]